jgi:predicted transcriptional regulator
MERHPDHHLLADQLFVIANADRLALLSEITIDKNRLSQLTAKLSSTPQETSRHLMLLRNAKLIEKDSAGFFGLTTFGKSILTLLPSIGFLTENREFFMTHDISSLPLEFIERIGELRISTYVKKAGSILVHAQQVLQNAQEYIWLMADHPLGGEHYLLSNVNLENCDITWRIIVPASSSRSIDWALLRRAIRNHKGRIEYCLLEDVSDIKAGIALNEKIAGVNFMANTGELDFGSGFTSTDPLFHKWCQDLFVIHWNKKGTRVQI